MNRYIRNSGLAVAAIATLTLAACGNDPLSPEALAGIYDLTRANGTDIPAVIRQTNDTTFEVVGGLLTLNPDTAFNQGLYSLSYNLRTTIANPAGDPIVNESGSVDSGAWQLEGDSLVFQPGTVREFAGTATPGSTPSVTVAVADPTRPIATLTLTYVWKSRTP